MTLKWILVSGKPVALFINDYSVRKSSVMMANRLATVFKYFYQFFCFYKKSAKSTPDSPNIRESAVAIADFSAFELKFTPKEYLQNLEAFLE